MGVASTWFRLSLCPLRNLDPLTVGRGNRSLAWLTQPGSCGTEIHVVLELGSEASSGSRPPYAAVTLLPVL